MTAPVAQPVADAADPSGPIPDDLLGAALTARAESNSRLLGMLPEGEPSAAATEPGKEAAPKAEAAAEPAKPEDASAPEGTDPSAPDPFATLLADAKPLTYKRNGAAETFDGILELTGKGALIPLDKLDTVRNLVARSEANAADTRRLYEQVQRQERFTYETRDAQGQPQAHKGLAAVHRMQEDQAYTNASSGVLFEYLTTPARLLSLLVQDEKGNISVSPAALHDLRDRARFAGERAAFETQSRRSADEASYAKQSQEDEALGAAIPDAIDTAFPDADPADREAAKAVFGPMGRALMFKATPEQAAQYGVPVGQWMVNVGTMAPWFDDRRTARAERSKAAEAAQRAAADNARRVPQKATAPVPPKPAAQRQPRNPDNGQFQEAPRRLSASEVFDIARSGGSISRTAAVTE